MGYGIMLLWCLISFIGVLYSWCNQNSASVQQAFSAAIATIATVYPANLEFIHTILPRVKVMLEGFHKSQRPGQSSGRDIKRTYLITRLPVPHTY